MRSTQTFSITVPNEMADMIKAKVSSGEYASESDVFRDGLRALQAQDKALDSWLLNDVLPAYDALKADPSRGVSASDMRATLATEHTRALKAR